jgi:uncharacterized protein (DUF58 family)
MLRSKPHLRATRHSIIFGGVLLAIWFAGINYENNLAYILLFLVFGMGVLSIELTYRNLGAIEVLPGKIEPVFVGQPAIMPLEVRNRGKRTSYAIIFEPSEGFSVGSPVMQSQLESDHAERCQLILKNQERGQYLISNIRVSTTYPFGIIESWISIPVQLRYVVYPIPKGNIPIPEANSEETNRSDAERRPGDDFYGLRSYLPGESQRRIDWKAVARGRPLMVREFSGNAGDRLWLDWEAISNPDPEARLSQLALWIVQARRNQTPYGLRLPGVNYAPGRGTDHYHLCMTALALFGKKSVPTSEVVSR